MHTLKLKKIKVNPNGTDITSPDYFPPSLSFNADQLPEIKDWKVGKKYKLIIEVMQKSKLEQEDSVSARFDILAYKHLKEKTIDEMDDKEFGEEQGKQLARHY